MVLGVMMTYKLFYNKFRFFSMQITYDCQIKKTFIINYLNVTKDYRGSILCFPRGINICWSLIFRLFECVCQLLVYSVRFS